MPSKDADPADLVAKEAELAYVYERASRILTPDQLAVLTRRFGKNNDERETIARCLGFSVERVRQLETEGLDKLRLDILRIPVPVRSWQKKRKENSR